MTIPAGDGTRHSFGTVCLPINPLGGPKGFGVAENWQFSDNQQMIRIEALE